MPRNMVIAFSLVVAFTAATQADIVKVDVTGTVIFRSGTLGAPLNGVAVGNTGVMSFNVDSNVFVDGIPGDVRSYPIIQPTFSLAFQPSGVSVGLLNPFPAGQTPYFSLVDGFPVSDGFFVSTSIVSPGGVPISQTPLQANLDLGYAGTTLSSLNILDAFGTYNFTGLTRFGYNIWQSIPDNVRLDMDFAQMTIAAVPEPTTLGMMTVTGLFALARRRRS